MYDFLVLTDLVIIVCIKISNDVANIANVKFPKFKNQFLLLS